MLDIFLKTFFSRHSSVSDATIFQFDLESILFSCVKTSQLFLKCLIVININSLTVLGYFIIEKKSRRFLKCLIVINAKIYPIYNESTRIGIILYNKNYNFKRFLNKAFLPTLNLRELFRLNIFDHRRLMFKNREI